MAQATEANFIPLSTTNRIDELLSLLNKEGFVVSVFQGSFSAWGGVDARVPKYLWHGSAYSRDRHNEFAKMKRELSYEEAATLPCFHYQLVAHHEQSLLSCLEKLWQEFLCPTDQPRATRSRLNPAFARHKKERRLPITDDDLLA